ncbi:hypothetical protein KQY30_14055 [Streptomyces sp. GMY02]|uniref:hypothetical protein n=1 Tax=Streptomyces sp. GMY02 TaxID=1333528 RepID=UPI001C2C0798|nr:hypothetical protein [Streptomyces sp. GMY02]QXE35228.1 hypothetical protein KQY30_14055 [Streptomyces sp. GMY02]
MSKSTRVRAGVAVTAVAVMVAVAGCQSEGSAAGGGKATTGAVKAQAAPATEVIAAAYKKTAEAKSARVTMTMETPGTGPDAGTIEMSGVMGWGPTVMDVTMSGTALASDPEGPEQVRMVWINNVMYMDMGAASAKEMDGKRWMKLDFAAIAKASGDAKAAEAMAGGLENMNQDPAQQLGILLESPSLKHVGSEKIGGIPTEHYKGRLTLEEMLKSNKSLAVLSAKERTDLLAAMKKSGLKAYDTEVWVNADSYPVKMDIGMDTPEGTVRVTASYTDYGVKTDVQAPPAGQTADVFKMLGDLAAVGQGADGGPGA